MIFLIWLIEIKKIIYFRKRDIYETIDKKNNKKK